MASLWDNLIGHESQREMLRQAIARGRLAHTFLFIGPPGIGKRLFAKAVAQSLLCEKHADADLDACGACSACRQVDSGSHPDLFQIGLPEGKRELPIALFVGDEEHRGRDGLCHDISLKPMAGRRKIAIIDDADCFNVESANCLLKLLEEPPPRSLLLLIGTTPDAQLPTIRSRCQVLRFSPLTSDQVIDILLREGLADDRSQAAAVAPLCDGSVRTASDLLDPQLRTLREAVVGTLAADGRARFDLALQLVELFEGGSEAAEQRQLAGWVVRFTIEFYRAALRESTSDVDAPARTVENLDLLGDLLDRAFQADEHLQSNMSPRLCIEGLLADLARLVRTRRAPAAAVR